MTSTTFIRLAILLAGAGTFALARPGAPAAGSGMFTELAAIDLQGQSSTLSVADDKAFLGNSYCRSGRGLLIVDLAGGAAPRVRSLTCDLAGGRFAGVVAGDGVVAAIDSGSKEPLLIDVRDPDAPKAGGRAAISGGLNGSMLLDGPRLALRQHNSGAIPDFVNVYDISLPEAPRRAAQLLLADPHPWDRSDGLAADRGVYYVVERDLRALRLVDDGALVEMGSAPVPRADVSAVDQLVVDTPAHRLYAVDGDRWRLWAYDIERPDAPRLLAGNVALRQPENTPSVEPLKVDDFVVRDGLAVMKVTEGPYLESRVLIALDVTDPAEPRQLGEPAPLRFLDIDLDDRGNLVAVATRDANPGIASRLAILALTERPRLPWRSWLPALFAASTIAPSAPHSQPILPLSHVVLGEGAGVPPAPPFGAVGQHGG